MRQAHWPTCDQEKKKKSSSFFFTRTQNVSLHLYCTAVQYISHAMQAASSTSRTIKGGMTCLGKQEWVLGVLCEPGTTHTPTQPFSHPHFVSFRQEDVGWFAQDGVLFAAGKIDNVIWSACVHSFWGEEWFAPALLLLLVGWWEVWHVGSFCAYLYVGAGFGCDEKGIIGKCILRFGENGEMKERASWFWFSVWGISREVDLSLRDRVYVRIALNSLHGIFCIKTKTTHNSSNQILTPKAETAQFLWWGKIFLNS